MAINEQGRPTFIAGEHTNSVEILETRSTNLKLFLLKIILSGWQNIQSHPAGKIERFTCASVPNGIITVGGVVSSFIKNVYLYRNQQWTIVGQMQNVNNFFLYYSI